MIAAIMGVVIIGLGVVGIKFGVEAVIAGLTILAIAAGLKKD